MRDARRAWRHPLRLLFPEFEEIKIKSAVGNFFSARECPFRDGEQRETWREGQRFLRACEHHVDAKRVHVDLHSGK